MPRIGRLGVPLICLLAARPLGAQLAPLGTPEGTLRLSLQGGFESADRRYRSGSAEDYLADFGSPAFGSNRIPLLQITDSLVGGILNQPGYKLNLGAEKARGLLTIGTGTVGAALGITRAVTLFAHVPFVTTEVRARVANDSALADGGLNPAHPLLGTSGSQALAASFFSSFDAALQALQIRIDGGSYAGNPSLDSLARAIAADGADLRNSLYTLTQDPTLASPFLPTAGSATGQQIITRVRGLQDTLVNTLGVTGSGFSADPVLADGRLTDSEFSGLLGNGSGPFQSFPLTQSTISRMGDMDVGAVVTLLDHFDRPGRRGGVRLAVTGLLRLPTGQRDNPHNLIDVGTGNGRYEAGVSGTLDIGSGAIGARLHGGYLLRLETFRVRRVTDPASPYAGITTLSNIREDAGDIMSLGARPFLRLARSLALHGLVDLVRIGEDQARYDRPVDAIPGVPASVLANASRTAVALGGGITYVGRAAHECEVGRRCGFPIDATWSYSTVVNASGGRVTKFRTTRIEIRWYQRIWR